METAKANGLHPIRYLTYLFEQLPQLDDPDDAAQIEPFLPWSPQLPLHCRVHKS
uniref:transposase domain-containing protein n=1 Tax=Paenibacillus sp. 598K TaxID=1117987 RepID=UPI000FFEA58E